MRVLRHAEALALGDEEVTETPPEIAPVATLHGIRYPCPTCGVWHEFMTEAVLCSFSHKETT